MICVDQHPGNDTSVTCSHPATPSYERLSLLELVSLVVERSDREALNEMHDRRRVFKIKEGKWSLLGEYLSLLREREQNRRARDARALALAERAYDLTLEKFINLPQAQGRKGADCRTYFRAFLGAAERSFQHKPALNRLEEEARAGSLLKGLVARQFGFSLREARREADPFWSRYQWRAKGRRFTVWMPVAMTGNERREWLEAHVPEIVLEQPQARERIQEIIEQSLVKEHFISWDVMSDVGAGGSSPGITLLTENWSVSLAEMVAQEKAQNIEQQRPGIKRLGTKRLTELILRIFEDLGAGEYEQKSTAARFGLSQATLSRFAGSDWHRNHASKGAVPDLWRNTANVISQIPVFREMAEEVGLLDTIEAAHGESHD